MGKHHKWTAADDALFLALSNAEIVARLNLPISKITQRRSRLRISSPSRVSLARRWAALDLTRPTGELARSLGISRQWVEQLIAAGGPKPLLSADSTATGDPRRRPWTADEDAKLGTMPDGQVGKAIRRGRNAVLRRRVLLNIPPFGG